MNLWQISALSLLIASNAAALPFDFTAPINRSQAQFHGEKTVVLLYDATGGEIVYSTPSADEMTFNLASLIKPLIIDEAIRQHAVTWDTVIDCGNGQLPTNGKILRDATGLGKLPVSEILNHRSNIGSFKILEKIGTTAIDQRLKAVNITGNPDPYDCATGWGITATIGQTVRLYALLPDGTKARLSQPYLSTGLLDTDWDNRRYFPCALGWVTFNGRPHLLFVGTVNPKSRYYAKTVAEPLWRELAAIIIQSSNDNDKK